eukprot:COSAG01_NODE_5258_length_4379_cov_23.575467_1_plen_395_part_00
MQSITTTTHLTENKPPKMGLTLALALLPLACTSSDSDGRGGGGMKKLDCLFGVNVHMYRGLYGNLTDQVRSHLGTAVTSLYGLGHGDGQHPPTPVGSLDFIDHPTQLFQPNSTSYWQAAWNRTLASAPGYMAAYVLTELRKNPNPNTNSTHPIDSGVVMLDYEPAYRPSWKFQTQARPDTRWEDLLEAIHTPLLDQNWTSLVGFDDGGGAGRGGWVALTNTQREALMELSWNYFCRAYLTAGMDAIRTALPASVQLSVWNWPYKFGGSTAANATALYDFETMIAGMDWLWQKLDLFLPDVYPEFYVGTPKTLPAVLSQCTVPRGCTLGSDGCTVANKSYADLYFSANIAHMQRVRARCNPTAKIYLSTWWHCECSYTPSRKGPGAGACAGCTQS